MRCQELETCGSSDDVAVSFIASVGERLNWHGSRRNEAASSSSVLAYSVGISSQHGAGYTIHANFPTACGTRRTSRSVDACCSKISARAGSYRYWRPDP